MTNVKDYFGGSFLKAEDYKGGEIVEILSTGQYEDIQTGDNKTKSVLNYVVSVNGVEKTFTPNKSNGQILIEAFGEDDAGWIGKKFIIRIEKIMAFGKRINSIIVDPVTEENVQKVAQKK